MNKLEKAARALLAHWDTPAWKYLKPTGDLMADLREALAGQVPEGFDYIEPSRFKSEQAEQRSDSERMEPVACPDKGLWTVKQWGTDKVVLLSGDFTHDVALAISGDFLDIEQRLDYALNLAAWMNHHLQNAAPVRTKDLTDDEIAQFWAVDGFYQTPTNFARAVIAADREKNK